MVASASSVIKAYAEDLVTIWLKLDMNTFENSEAMLLKKAQSSGADIVPMSVKKGTDSSRLHLSCEVKWVKV